MMKSFVNAPSPVLASVVRERTVKECIGAIKNSEYGGAGAIDLHLSCLDREYKNVESIKEILNACRLPVLVLNYNHNYDYSSYDCDEEERIRLLEIGAEAGASAIDMQAYSFNIKTKTSFQAELATDSMLFAAKKPNEVALDKETVDKQLALIDKMHKNGTEVLLSCHTGVYLNCEEAVSLCRLLEKRNPDIIKLVMPCNTDEELAEQFKTMITLKKEITGCKIHFHCSGKKGKVTRIVNPMLGAHLAFCIERYGINASPEQLELRSYADAINKLDWGE